MENFDVGRKNAEKSSGMNEISTLEDDWRVVEIAKLYEKLPRPLHRYFYAPLWFFL